MKQTVSKKSKLKTGYKYGFTTDIESEQIPKGIDEKTVRLISSIKKEPKWVTDFRLKGYRSWVRQEHPEWHHLDIPEIDFLSQKGANVFDILRRDTLVLTREAVEHLQERLR